jgi:hypothetical protein
LERHHAEYAILCRIVNVFHSLESAWIGGARL